MIHAQCIRKHALKYNNNNRLIDVVFGFNAVFQVIDFQTDFMRYLLKSLTGRAEEQWPLMTLYRLVLCYR